MRTDHTATTATSPQSLALTQMPLAARCPLPGRFSSQTEQRVQAEYHQMYRQYRPHIPQRPDILPFPRIHNHIPSRTVIEPMATRRMYHYHLLHHPAQPQQCQLPVRATTSNPQKTGASLCGNAHDPIVMACPSTRRIQPQGP